MMLRNSLEVMILVFFQNLGNENLGRSPNRGLDRSGTRSKAINVFGIVVARDGVEPPTPAFSGL